MVNVIINSDSRYKINKVAIQQAVVSTLEENKVKGDVEVEVSVVGNRKMHELNKSFRGMDYPADILTFPFEDPNPHGLQHVQKAGFIAYPDKVLRLGCILISYNQALEDAASEGKSLDSELVFLVEHGCQHLLGHHHN